MRSSAESETRPVSKTALVVVVAVLAALLLVGVGFAAGAARSGPQNAFGTATAGAEVQFYDIQLFIGHEVDGVPTLSSDEICAAAEEVLGLESYTAQEADGVYMEEHEDSTVISILQVDAATKDSIVANVSKLASRLQQGSILISVDLSTADLIYAE